MGRRRGVQMHGAGLYLCLIKNRSANVDFCQGELATKIRKCNSVRYAGGHLTFVNAQRDSLLFDSGYNINEYVSRLICGLQ